MRVIILIFILLGLKTSAQESPIETQKESPKVHANPKLKIGFGVNYAVGKEMRKVFSLGNTLSGELSMVHTDKIDIIPLLSLSYYANFLNEGIRNDLFLTNIGCSMLYYSTKSKKMALKGGVSGILGGDKLRLRKNYEGENIALYFHKGFSVNGGIVFIFEKSSLELNYNYVLSFSKIKKDALKLYQNQVYGNLDPPLYSVLDLPIAKLNLSNIQLTYTRHFKL
jgi:hypothetical protein